MRDDLGIRAITPGDVGEFSAEFPLGPASLASTLTPPLCHTTSLIGT